MKIAVATRFKHTGFDDNNQNLINATNSGELKRRYEAGESLRDIAVSLGSYSKAVREQLVSQGVRIRGKFEIRKGKLPKTDLVMASKGAEVLTVLLKNDAVSQADIDALATPAKSVAPATGTLTEAEAAKQIDAIVKQAGGHITHKVMGQIFGYSPSWYANIKGRS